jgi:hypothetical protein
MTATSVMRLRLEQVVREGQGRVEIPQTSAGLTDSPLCRITSDNRLSSAMLRLQQ